MSKIDLYDALSRRTYDHAVICSFTFDAQFFEDICLEKFPSLYNNANITVLVDKGVYEEIILGPDSLKPKKANLRYLFFPVSVPGVFHPKLCLLVGKTKGKLFIGSANYTKSGITSNAEMVGVYEYEVDKNEHFKALFRQSFRYLLELAETLNSDNLNSNLQEITRKAEWLVEDNFDDEDGAKLLHNLKEPLWSQIVDGVAPPVDTIFVLSRFFDKQPEFLDRIENDLAPKKILIYTQNGVTNLTPKWLEHPLVKNGKAEILLCRFTDNSYVQPLHAKAIAIQTGNRVSLVFGSANFSSPALLRTFKTGNAEILLKLPDLSVKDFQPQLFFDPEKTALRLTDGSILQGIENNEEKIVEERRSYKINLIEATFNDLENGNVTIRAKIPLEFRFNEIFAKLTFSNGFSYSARIQNREEDTYVLSISQETKRHLNEGSTIVEIEVLQNGNLIAQSNSLLVTNLKDIKTDKPVRRERYLKEAQQSAAQFFSVLQELLKANDKESILTFLNFCDIPLGSFDRPAFLRSIRPVWDGGEGMRKLGDKNLKIYTELHPAVLYFFDKHFKKLQRHVQQKDIHGMANFFHIFLAMGSVLQSQIERIVQGLESKTTPITIAEWTECREKADIYLGRFRELMECLWRDYLSQMAKGYKRSEIRERFLPDYEAINKLVTGIMKSKDRVEKIRGTSLKLKAHNGGITTPGYFNCKFKLENWSRYSNQINQQFAPIILLAS
jgi:hypothetical protein